MLSFIGMHLLLIFLNNSLPVMFLVSLTCLFYICKSDIFTIANLLE